MADIMEKMYLGWQNHINQLPGVQGKCKIEILHCAE